jgi:hypothetical protein
LKRNNSYIYPKTIREVIDGKRHYDINDSKLPSVTTILSATQTAEKRESLAAWRQSIGEENATRIVDQAGARGTAMHKILEKYILEQGYLDLTNVGKEAHNMALRVIEQGLCNVTEFYGSECTLYYPGLYAGQTDLIAMHKNEMAVIEAYGMAHDYVYKTSINKAVIMMCSKDNFYQEFIIEGEEYKKYKHKWLRRVDEYYKNRSEKTG